MASAPSTPLNKLERSSQTDVQGDWAWWLTLASPLISLLYLSVPHQALSPALKGFSTNPGLLHAGLLCYLSAYGSPRFLQRFTSTIPILLPWSFTGQHHFWDLLVPAVFLAQAQGLLAHRFQSLGIYRSLLSLELIWLFYRPFFFEQLPITALSSISFLSIQPHERSWGDVLSLVGASGVLILLGWIGQSLIRHFRPKLKVQGSP